MKNGLTHLHFMGTRWPFASWYACCHIFERNAPRLDAAMYNYAVNNGIVFG